MRVRVEPGTRATATIPFDTSLPASNEYVTPSIPAGIGFASPQSNAGAVDIAPPWVGSKSVDANRQALITDPETLPAPATA